jgi:hypothetical protein
MALTGIARLDDECWLVIGRRYDAGAYAALYRPLQWSLQPVVLPQARALLACAARWERNQALAVGSDGVVLEIENDNTKTTTLPSRVDLTSVAIDTLGHKWATSLGRIWLSRETGQWHEAHQLPQFQVPFVSITAEVGMVTAMTADGGVVECRSDATDITTPA